MRACGQQRRGRLHQLLGELALAGEENAWSRCIVEGALSYVIDNDEGDWRGARERGYLDGAELCARAGNTRVEAILTRNAAYSVSDPKRRAGLFARMTRYDRDFLPLQIVRPERAAISGDNGLLRALEAVPREAFVPHRYADLAARNIALPLACGQVQSEPALIARMLEALAVRPAHRVLGGRHRAVLVLRQRPQPRPLPGIPPSRPARIAA